MRHEEPWGWQSGMFMGRGPWGRHGHGTPPPPCDSSLLAPKLNVLRADVVLTSNGVFFTELELLPAVQ